jgi:hypothetical protein
MQWQNCCVRPVSTCESLSRSLRVIQLTARLRITNSEPGRIGGGKKDRGRLTLLLFMQGAPKRTSGRSHPWSAPLRATSSVSYISTWLAILKLHKMQGRRFVRFVGIALRLERFTFVHRDRLNNRKNRENKGVKSRGRGTFASGNSCMSVSCACDFRYNSLATSLTAQNLRP